MSFQVSPGVQVKEIDKTNSIPAVSTSIGGIALAASWGPINEVQLVSSEKDLIKKCGVPTDFTAQYFFAASQFLSFGSALKYVRAKTDSTNANALGATTTLVENLDDYENTIKDGTSVGTNGIWTARYAGTRGNSIKVSICPADSALFDAWEYANIFDSAPSTSDFALSNGISDDEMHIVVIDELGYITGTPLTVLEKFEYVSQLSDAKTANGTNNYYKEVVAKSSPYIYWTGHDTGLTDAGTASSGISGAMTTPIAVIDSQLSGGQDDTTVAVGDLLIAYDYLANAQSEDVNLMIAPPVTDDADGVTLANYIGEICAERKDAVGFISPPISTTVNNADPATAVKNFVDQLNSTSYATVDSTAVKIYDRYNDIYRWVSASGNHAGLYAYTDQVADSWFSGAGLNRGFLRGVAKIAFNPTQAERDKLYKARVNPIIASPGEGIVMFGDKTLLSKPSAFSRINVRRLFIVLEKAISTASKYQLFELNDEFTRAIFRNMVEPFLRNVQGRRGVEDFKVVCDETNNTGEIISSNQFIADIYIKPAMSINFITLNFVAVRSGVDFNEIAS